MLREYISRKIQENEERGIELEGDIRRLQSRKKELEKHIEIIEDENNDGSEIFSPRNHREQNFDKLKHYREDIEKISQEIEEKLCKLSEARKKKSEYESMLEEAERNHLEEEKIYSDLDLQTKDQNQEAKAENSRDGEQQNQTTKAENSQNGEQRDQERGTEKGEIETSSEQQSVERLSDDQAETRISQRKDEQISGQAARLDGQATEPEREANEDQKKQQNSGLTKEKEDETAEDQGKSEERYERREEQPEYEEQETGRTDMDTKEIIQKSIEEIVRRIGKEESRNPDQIKGRREYTTGRSGRSGQTAGNIFGPGRDSNLDGIEIKSGELIVLESERRKEKEFLEKVKKGIDLSYVYSGNRNKCRGELIKIKRMIEDYISSIEE